jgi:serine phosphatase RsbU (regulator of sigma subunit)
MTSPGPSEGLGAALTALLSSTTDVSPSELTSVVDRAGEVLGASTARVLIADYGLTSLQELGEDGPTGPRQTLDGTMAGRAFSGGEVMVSGREPAVVLVPLAEGSERLGVLEMTHPAWDDQHEALLAPVARILVLLLISRRRYTDVVLRARRSEQLSPAAELQWDLLPPLTCSTPRVSVSGILEPAYSIGGDSFDYALNQDRAELAIVDAMGHGMAAVLLSVSAINCLRNARREARGLDEAYLTTGAAISAQATGSAFVTGQMASLDLTSGDLTWLNAGHPRPLLVRDGTFIGELSCRPSLPMGWGGGVAEIATEHLQPGDRVLFYTDGAVETRSPSGELFGLPRLADLFVRASREDVPPSETVRRLSTSIVAYNGAGLSDDATLLLLSYHGTPNSR